MKDQSQQPIDLELLVEAAFENIYLQAYGDNHPNGVEIKGKEEFIAQLARDLERAGVRLVKR